MYMENNRPTSPNRANDDFLRRMLGGELKSGERAVMNKAEEASQESRPSDCVFGKVCARREGMQNEPRERNARGEDRPKCNDGDENECECPKYMRMPSLAMVYAPHQCWQNLLDPESALGHGSQFAELILPLEADGNMGMGGKGRC